MSKKEGKRMSVTSTFSLPLFQRSSSTTKASTSSSFSPSPSTSTSTSRVPSLTSTASSVPSNVTTPRPPSPQSSISLYNPLDNYIPCLHPNCSTHYLPTLLGPTFYSPQLPYNLSRKYGFCPPHASRELKNANEGCKREFERMRQNAGRKTLRTIDSEFEDYLERERRIRREDSKANERAMKYRILGPTTDQLLAKGKQKTTHDEQWDWRYTLRPCTSQTCPHPHIPYSPFHARFYPWYMITRRSGLAPLFHLCPRCARRDIDAMEKQREEKWREMPPHEWNQWKKQLLQERVTEQIFWEEAQGKRVRPLGWSKEEKREEGELVQGKGAEVVREVCVVM